MKPQKTHVIQAIKETLKTKERYKIEDIIEYLRKRNIHTTRKEVMSVIVEMIQGKH